MNIKSLFNLQTTELDVYNHKVNGTIADAIKQYESYNVPLRQLLSHYNEILTHPGLREKAINPWLSLNYDINNNDILSGVSVEETLFNLAAMKLHRQKPIDVIKSIYYRNKNRNDSTIEKVFIDSIRNSISSDKKVLVVNPSPYVIENLMNYHIDAQYLMLDNVLASLYSKQYTNSSFTVLNTDSTKSDADIVIIFATLTKQPAITDMLKLLSNSSISEVYCIMQTKLIDNKRSDFWNALAVNEEYKINDIIIVPNEISNSSPRKKCFVSIHKSKLNLFLLENLELDSDNHSIVPSPAAKEINIEELLKENITINKLWNNDNAIVEDHEPLYSAAQQYQFSKEIIISYSIYVDNHGLYGKAYYGKTKNVNTPTARGKRITNRIEKGLHAKTEEEILIRMEQVPYYPSVTRLIAEDITKNYLIGHHPTTLKSLWFCLRPELSTNNSYNDSLLKELFTNNSYISELYPDITTSKQIEEALNKSISDGEETKAILLLKQLNLVVDIAIKKGYLFQNRILPLLPAASIRASKRQSEVRQALTKRSFERIEEKKILSFLRKRYIESSIYLGVIIRLFTGITNKEACALQWQDFVYDANSGVSKLSITKCVDSNGKLLSHALKDNWEKYRVLPITGCLEAMIDARKRHLLNLGLDEKSIADYPIILQRENTVSMLKGHRPEFCKPALLAEKCREAIASAEIPQHLIILPEDGNEIETDINSYNGDIFRTNFRDKAINEAGFGLDELHYYLGIKKPDTFSQHYCDYTNEYVQLIMASKLNRWGLKYIGLPSAAKYNSPKKRTEIKAVGIRDGVPTVDLTIKSNKSNFNAIIEVTSQYGFKSVIN